METLRVEIGEWVRTRWVGIYQVYRVLESPKRLESRFGVAVT